MCKVLREHLKYRKRKITISYYWYYTHHVPVELLRVYDPHLKIRDC